MKLAKLSGIIAGAILFLFAVFTIAANYTVENGRPTSAEVQELLLSGKDGTSLDNISSTLLSANLLYEIIFADDRRFLSGNFVPDEDKEGLKQSARLMLSGAKRVRSEGFLQDSWVEYKLYFDSQNQLLKVYVFPWSKII